MHLNNRILIPAAIFVLALSAGLVYITFFPQFSLSQDALEYDALGRNLSVGYGYCIQRGVPDVTREPLYSLFLGGIYAIFGHNLTIVRILQALINASTCLMIYFTGRMVFGIRRSLVACLIIAFYPAFITYSGYILNETLFNFLLATAMFFLISAVKDNSLGRFFLAGIFLGLGILTKAVLLLFPFFIFLVLGKGRIKALLCLIFMAGLVVLPWTLRNYRVSGAFIPVRVGSGVAMWTASYLPWEGQSRAGRGGYPEARVQYIETEPLKTLVKGLDSVEADKVASRQAIKNIRNNPMGYLGVSLKRVALLWKDPIGKELIKEKSLPASLILTILHYFILFFGIIGMIRVVANIRRWGLALPAFWLVIYFTAMYVFTYAHPRYQLPVMPYVILFSVYGFLSLAKGADK